MDLGLYTEHDGPQRLGDDEFTVVSKHKSETHSVIENDRDEEVETSLVGSYSNRGLCPYIVKNIWMKK